MEILYSALLLGIVGSLHCVGMCGPIAISLPLRGKNNVQKISGGILYNLGRTLTYGLMGAVFGLIGQGFQLMGFQQWISVIMGAIMVASVIMPSMFRKLNSGKNIPFAGTVRKGIQNLFAKRSFGGLFLIGLLNGLLPCGLVYMAIAGAIGTGNFYYAIAFMVLFGLGTLPVMLFITLLGNMISLTVRNKINKIIPILVVLIGIIFILRGLSLGIPFLSPPKEKLNPEIHMQKNAETPSDAVKGSCCHGKE